MLLFGGTNLLGHAQICLNEMAVHYFLLRQMSMKQQEGSPKTYIHDLDKHYLVQVNQQYKCVCELCSCGKHRCPRPAVKGEFETSYNSHYKNTHMLIPTSPSPQYVYQDRHYPADTLRTNYKESFTDKPHIENAETLNKSRLEYFGKSVLRPNVPFYGNSSYSQQFKPFSLQNNYNPEEDTFINRREKIPHYGFQHPAKLDDSTAYKDYFQAPTPSKQQKSPYPEYHRPQVAFEGASSYKSQFKDYKIEPKYEQLYNQAVTNAPKVKFDGNTTYKDLFKDFTVMPEEQSTGKGCYLDNTNHPKANFLHSSPHISHDERPQRYQ